MCTLWVRNTPIDGEDYVFISFSTVQVCNLSCNIQLHIQSFREVRCSVIPEKLTALSLCWNSGPTLNLKDHVLLTEAWSRIQLSQLSTKLLKWGQDQFQCQVFLPFM